MNAAKDAQLKRAKLQFEQNRYDETKKQISEYVIFKTTFWGVGIILTIAGLFFWMDSTYYDELVKAQSQIQYHSKYAECVQFVYIQFQRFKLIVIAIATLLIGFLVFLFINKR